MRIIVLVILVAALASSLTGVQDRADLDRQSLQLKAQIQFLNRPERPDVAIFQKAAEWALRYDTQLSDADCRLLQRLLARGRERAATLESGQAGWMQKRGRMVCGFISQVDGSVQPYGLIVPRTYDPLRPMRLDVVLHGSSSPVGMSEARFIQSFDDADSGRSAPDASFIELHPLGRVENCYRWSGETDVYEAIEDVCRRYRIDRDRIVLRGMSMGASGTWHLGLKRPDRFAALGPYCGYVDTHHFSHTPGMNFVPVDALPDYQEDGLHMLDSIDYAANANMVPCVAAMGREESLFEAHVLMRDAMQREGLSMVNLISPGTGHVQDPVTFAEQMRRLDAAAAQGVNHLPNHIRFVTWTLKYNRCHWIEILGLERHYRRTEVDAELPPGDTGTVRVRLASNITRLAIYPPSERCTAIVIGSSRISIPRGVSPLHAVLIERRGERWRLADRRNSDKHGGAREGKRPGVQGPIDDAFTSRFLCVRGTGTAWNPRVGAWADATLRRFAYEFARYFRGDPPVKDDTAVTEDDRQSCNLILFGDPGSNRLIREVLPRLPIRWSRLTLRMGNMLLPSANHAPVLIAPNPFTRDHYVVINSGHTFHEAELNRLNYLLFPRLGDWAAFQIAPGSMPASPSEPLPERLLRAGMLDEDWKYAPDR